MGYKISDDGKAITCLRCNITSHNPNDVKYRYCGKCRRFLDPAMEEAARRIRG